MKTVMRNLSFERFDVDFWGNESETFIFSIYKQGCMGLNKIRLNYYEGPLDHPKSRGFATLDAAIQAQKEMISTSSKSTRIVITAYQDNYLNEQLTPFLLPNSKTDYDLTNIRKLRFKTLPGITPKGDLTTFDFVTVHQNRDLSVRFYETMDYGVGDNPDLIVKHNSKLYPPTRAGTVYIVTPIKHHPAAPASPLGQN